MRRILIALIGIPGFLLIAQAALFLTILLDDDPLTKADLVAVFAGSAERVKAAYDLIDSSYARNLVISPASEGMLDRFERTYRPAEPFTRIMEKQARTTFENALHTEEIAARHNLKSIILVTSWYHMPRALILLRLTSIGSGRDTQPFGVATGTISLANWYRHGVGWKMVYNEMLECWGSLLELVRYRWTGRLPEKAPDPSAIVRLLKKALLFEIDDRSLR